MATVVAIAFAIRIMAKHFRVTKIAARMATVQNCTAIHLAAAEFDHFKVCRCFYLYIYTMENIIFFKNSFESLLRVCSLD